VNTLSKKTGSLAFDHTVVRMRPWLCENGVLLL